MNNNFIKIKKLLYSNICIIINFFPSNVLLPIYIIVDCWRNNEYINCIFSILHKNLCFEYGTEICAVGRTFN